MRALAGSFAWAQLVMCPSAVAVDGILRTAPSSFSSLYNHLSAHNHHHHHHQQQQQLPLPTNAQMQGFRLTMEDSMDIRLARKESPYTFGKSISFFGVFDGHGGDKASAFVAQSLYPQLFSTSDPRKPANIVETMVKLDAEFCQRKQDRKQGTTCVFALVEKLNPKDPKNAKNPGGYRVVVSNLGDSRALLVRSSGRFLPLTKDHKPDNFIEKQRIESAGGNVSFHRVDGDLAVSRAIGDYIFKNNSYKGPREQKVIAVPEVSMAVARPGDSLLLCCDGLFERLTSKQVAGFIYQEVMAQQESPQYLDPAEITSRLISRSLMCGSGDNMSAILVCFMPNGEIKEGGNACAGLAARVGGAEEGSGKIPKGQATSTADSKNEGKNVTDSGPPKKSDTDAVGGGVTEKTAKKLWNEQPKHVYEKGLMPPKASRQYTNAYKADAVRVQTKIADIQTREREFEMLLPTSPTLTSSSAPNVSTESTSSSKPTKAGRMVATQDVSPSPDQSATLHTLPSKQQLVKKNNSTSCSSNSSSGGDSVPTE